MTCPAIRGLYCLKSLQIPRIVPQSKRLPSVRTFSASRPQAKRKRGDADIVQLGHDPALLPQVLDALKPRNGELYLDLTFGGGGMTRAVLDSAACSVVGLDRDPAAIDRAKELQEEVGERNFKFLQAKFSTFEKLLPSLGPEFSQGPCFHGAILDAGTSSFQLDDPTRGFNLYSEGPLDMRMDAIPEPYDPENPVIEGAARVVNFATEQELADIIFHNSDERYSRHIARRIVEARAIRPISSTAELAKLVVSAIPRYIRNRGHDGVFRHAATRTFQALRVQVNDEFGELRTGLAAMERLLLPGARFVVLTFHSTEDRIAKDFFHACAGKRTSNSSEEGFIPTFMIPEGNKKVVKPTWQETQEHPRWRSAKMRVGIRTEAKEPVYKNKIGTEPERL